MSRPVSEERKKEVKRAAQARYRASHKEEIAEYRKQAKTSGRAAQWQADFYQRHRERLLAEQKIGQCLIRKRERGRRYMQRTRVPLRVSDPEKYAQYLLEKTERLRIAGVVLAAKRRVFTPETKRIYKRLRSRLYNATKRGGGSKSGDTRTLLGISVDEFYRYIADQFVPGMSWSNYGEWEIDHKRPVASFDLSDPEQQRVCFHHTNMQPLWRSDNRRKADKVELV